MADRFGSGNVDDGYEADDEEGIPRSGLRYLNRRPQGDRRDARNTPASSIGSENSDNESDKENRPPRQQPATSEAGDYSLIRSVGQPGSSYSDNGSGVASTSSNSRDSSPDIEIWQDPVRPRPVRADRGDTDRVAMAETEVQTWHSDSDTLVEEPERDDSDASPELLSDPEEYMARIRARERAARAAEWDTTSDGESVSSQTESEYELPRPRRGRISSEVSPSLIRDHRRLGVQTLGASPVRGPSPELGASPIEPLSPDYGPRTPIVSEGFGSRSSPGQGSLMHATTNESSSSEGDQPARTAGLKRGRSFSAESSDDERHAKRQRNDRDGYGM